MFLVDSAGLKICEFHTKFSCNSFSPVVHNLTPWDYFPVRLRTKQFVENTCPTYNIVGCNGMSCFWEGWYLESKPDQAKRNSVWGHSNKPDTWSSSSMNSGVHHTPRPQQINAEMGTGSDKSKWNLNIAHAKLSLHDFEMFWSGRNVFGQMAHPQI